MTIKIENKVRKYFKKKYGVNPTETQLKETADSLKLLGKVIFKYLRSSAITTN